MTTYAIRGGAEGYCEWYCTIVARRGGDAMLGRQLFGLLVEAGLERVRMRMFQLVHTDVVPEKALSLSTLENIGDAVVADGLATRAELEETVAELERFTADPRSMIGMPRIFQVWGRRSADLA